MHIEEHISELLYDHDCVIVPDFGGFIGNYAPARIDEVKHLFEPPRKKILFNKGLTQNDGLLANYLSNKERVTYTEAIKHIAEEVKRYRSELKQHKRISLENIGILFIDEHNNLIFQPDEKINYLPEAFGLSSFFRLPVENEKKEEKESVVVQLHKERTKLRPYAIAAAIGALVASTFWFAFNQTAISNYSSLNIFSKKAASQYVFSPVSSLARTPVNTPKDTLNIVIKQATKTDINAAAYHIVAGCFRYYSNAQNLVDILQKQHIEAAIVGKNLQGLYIVGCGKYATYDAAEAQLDNFRKNVQQGAWVYAKGM